MPALLAYKGDATLKKILLKEVLRHQKADQIVQGTYGHENGKWRGCAVGCAIHSLNIKLKKEWRTNDHTVYEKELGISERLARLEDSIFEGLTQKEAVKFPARFIAAIPVGADLSRVIPLFCEWLLIDPTQGVIRFAREEDKKTIRDVAALHAKEGAGGKVSEEEWSAARSAAWSAARSAAWSAARSAAWSAESAAWSAQAEKLLELLAAAPVKK